MVHGRHMQLGHKIKRCLQPISESHIVANDDIGIEANASIVLSTIASNIVPKSVCSNITSTITSSIEVSPSSIPINVNATHNSSDATEIAAAGELFSLATISALENMVAAPSMITINDTIESSILEAARPLSVTPIINAQPNSIIQGETSRLVELDFGSNKFVSLISLEEEEDALDLETDSMELMTPLGKRILRDRPVRPSTKAKEMTWQAVGRGRGRRGGAVYPSDYGEALTKSLLYFEAQRSGKLPLNQRVDWRGDSALRDGSDAHIDLTGGYYDAGDNMKFGFPMAFTTTMLAWSSVEMTSELMGHMEHENVLAAIKWATDYLIKAHPEPNVLYGQVGDANSDHACWMRPEDMTTPRPSYRIDAQHPGADLAGETAAAMAAASLAFEEVDVAYAKTLLDHAKDLFEFGKNYPGVYHRSIPNAAGFYASSGYEDEMLWAAAWLHRATGDQTYLDYLLQCSGTGGPRSVFAWDDKYVGAQVLVSKLVLEGKVANVGKFAEYKNMADQFICNCAQKGYNNVKKTPGGLLYFLPWDNLQYTATASLVLATYSYYLEASHASVRCPHGVLQASDLLNLARAQVDYILGSNPKSMSYMVGLGTNYPKRPHHRGASIVSIKKDSKQMACNEGFQAWYNNPKPNPNVLVGAIVGGPDENDAYDDVRSDFQHGEPDTATVAPMVGVLAAVAYLEA
ncbi:hypothetical protein AALP_AA4G234600 [Arabis alpina]|uniref:Endoglucanase n=1 Tax=Arabis alpina TaxID=50452 RepID=A0A087H559_ARAAL|nr:hypothetical protein AALP_AA4G234600 [Arabis alpina]